MGQLRLDGLKCNAELNAADEKNREGTDIFLRPDLAADLREWIAGSELPASARLFTVPDKLSKIMNRDLKAAGVEKWDERGRVVDVHALRTTFGTVMSVGGVAPRTAQVAMRHSKLDLTMNVYTDPKLLGVVAALQALTILPLDTASEFEKITGETVKLRCEPLTVQLTGYPEFGCHPVSSGVFR